MKKIYVYSLAAALATVALPALTGCSDDNFPYETATEGSVVLSARYSTDVKVASRASQEELAAELGSSTLVWISNDKGLVRKYEGLDNLPTTGIKLAGGNYVAEAWAGDSVSASFDKKYFKGRAPFTVTSSTTHVEIPCRIANVVVSVAYADAVDDALTNYSMKIEHHRGSLTFEGRDDRKGYLMMPTGYSDLTWTLTGTLANGQQFTKTGDILDVKPATEYAINVRYSHTDEAVGGAFVEIVIDESAVESEDEILITTPPMIQGVNYNLADGVFGNFGAIGRASVYITAATELDEVTVETSAIASIVGGDDVEILGAASSVTSALNAAGITWERNYNATDDLDALKLNFGAAFTNNLPIGTYPIKITALDKFGKSTTATLVITVSEAYVEALPVDESTIDYTTLVLRGALMKPEATNYGFEYRDANPASRADGWTFVQADRLEGTTYTVTLTGLKAGHTYEYRAVCDEYVSTNILRVTAKAYPQLPNAGFEDWSGSSPRMIYAEGGQMFWDSGNTGSATMKKNVTLPSSDVKHSGKYSAELKSQFVGVGSIGKFAAGNIFIGKYLATDGTDGVLGWGRPFTHKPVALRGYVQYTPGTVDQGSDIIAQGQSDEGIIYLALLDDTMLDPATSTEFPVVIKTKSANRQLFDKNGSNVIAYGEIVFKTATNGMIEFEIPLNYVRPDATPSYILCTAAASRGGDYFNGSTKSVMYIDDFELVYE